MGPPTNQTSFGPFRHRVHDTHRYTRPHTVHVYVDVLVTDSLSVHLRIRPTAGTLDEGIFSLPSPSYYNTPRVLKHEYQEGKYPGH